MLYYLMILLLMILINVCIANQLEMIMILLCLYVDDILIFCTSINVINETKVLLSIIFLYERSRVAHVVLGLQIERTHERIGISQSHYIEKVLKRFNYFDCKSVSTLFDSSNRLVKNRGESVIQLKYSQVICFLDNIANRTGHDILI